MLYDPSERAGFQVAWHLSSFEVGSADNSIPLGGRQNLGPTVALLNQNPHFESGLRVLRMHLPDAMRGSLPRPEGVCQVPGRSL